MNFLNTFLEKTIKTTAFAEFIRMYSVVLKKATDRQLDVIRKAQTAQ
jgi:hypothetical protein